MNTTQDLQRELRDKGTSLNDFASRHGYKYRTVCIVAQRWWHRNDRTPHGGLARAILAELKKEIAIEKMDAQGGNDGRMD